MGGHVLDGAGKSCGLFVAVVLSDNFGHTEIAYLYVSLVDEDVLGLDVTVDYTLLFEELQSDYVLGGKPF